MNPQQNDQRDLRTDDYIAQMFDPRVAVSLLRREPGRIQWQADVTGTGVFLAAPPPELPSSQHGWVIDYAFRNTGPEIRERSITRGTGGSMATAANCNLQIVSSSVPQRERNVVYVFHEGNNMSIVLRIGGSPSHSLAVSLVTGSHNITFVPEQCGSNIAGVSAIGIKKPGVITENTKVDIGLVDVVPGDWVYAKS